MSNTVYETIVQLPAGSQPLSGQEAVEVVQSGQSVQVTTGAIAALGGGGGGSGVIVPPLTAHGVLVGEGINPVNVAAPGNAGQVLTSNGANADPSMQSLPTIAVAGGGTGATSLLTHGVVVGEGTAAVAVIAPGTTGQILTSNGPNADPSMKTFTVPLITVPGGGTGQTSFTANGVLIGSGVSALGVVAPGTAGQVLTSNGTGSAPTMQTPTGSTYPPSPTPNMQTFLQNAVDAGVGADWIWGDYVTPSPIVITINFSVNDINFDFHGAHISASFVNTSEDVLTFIIPDTAPLFTQIQGFQIHNLTIYGVNTSGTPIAQNCLTLSCKSHNFGFFGIGLFGVSAIGCARSGIFFYGAVFEADLFMAFCRGCVFAGVEFRNPDQSTGGLISSINLHGGDLRVNGPFTNVAGNGYGLALTADIAFQESGGIFVYGTNFIGNCSSGINAPSGIRMVIGSHFENNCSNNGGENNGAVWLNSGGVCNLLWCDAAHSNGNGQTYLMQNVGGGGTSVIYWGYSFNEDTDTGEATAKLTGTGILYMDPDNTTGSVIGPGGGWTLNIENVTAYSV